LSKGFNTMSASRFKSRITCFLLSIVLGSGVAHACLLADRLRVVAPHLSEEEVQAYAHGSMEMTIIPYAFPGPSSCIDGMADIFPCDSVDLVGFLTLEEIGGGNGNDVWGWTDPVTGHEFALVGRSNGIAFVDISTPTVPVYVGNLPSHTGNSSTWRDVKVYDNHAFVVSDNNSGHGMQVFDLNQLRDVAAPPVTFSNTAHYSDFSTAHNIVINEDTGFAYAVGSNTCSGGLHMIDISTPASPVGVGCFSGDGYTHDAQCVIYNGPDTEHKGSEICFNSNEDTVTVVDVTDKSAPVQLSRTPYTRSGYTHQGWLTDDQSYFVHDDELDELDFGHNTRTYTWNVSDLDAPVLAGHWDADGRSIDHNQYIKGDFTYQANYRRGLRILEITDPENGELAEYSFFDTYPTSDGNGFSGAWSVYPYFESGLVIVSDISRGLFILRPQMPGMIFESDFEAAFNSRLFHY